MSHWERAGNSDDWFTPKFIFDALGECFDLDVAAPKNGPKHVPCKKWLAESSLDAAWFGFIWMNPPFGGRNALIPWMEKFFQHGNGLALTPDRTSAPWFAESAHAADAMLFTFDKVKFERPDGSLGKSPSNGTTLWASGRRAELALLRAQRAGLGFAVLPMNY
jgi:hypothetical protein